MSSDQTVPAESLELTHEPQLILIKAPVVTAGVGSGVGCDDAGGSVGDWVGWLMVGTDVTELWVGCDDTCGCVVAGIGDDDDDDDGVVISIGDASALMATVVSGAAKT